MYEFELAILGLVISAVAIYIAYRTHKKLGGTDKRLTDLYSKVVTYQDAELRLGDKRGEIFLGPDGKYNIRWLVDVQEKITISADVKASNPSGDTKSAGDAK